MNVCMRGREGGGGVGGGGEGWRVNRLVASFLRKQESLPHPHLRLRAQVECTSVRAYVVCLARRSAFARLLLRL